MHLNIVLIDDNFAIRQVLKQMFSRIAKKYTLDIHTFTSNNGVDGLGLIYITKPSLILVDTTIPKFSGKELIDFVIHNDDFYSENIKVIVMHDDLKNKLNLPHEFTLINKASSNFYNKLEESILTECKIWNTYENATFFKTLSSRILREANNQDLSEHRLGGSKGAKKLTNNLKKIFYEVLAGSLLTLLIIIYGKPFDQNTSQYEKDLSVLNFKYYPTFAVMLITFTMFFINVFLFSFGQFAIYYHQLEQSKAWETNIDENKNLEEK